MQFELKSKKRDLAAETIKEIRKAMPKRKTVILNGEEYTSDQLCAVYQGEIDALEAVGKAQKALHTALEHERAASKRVNGIDRQVREVLRIGNEKKKKNKKRPVRPTA